MTMIATFVDSLANLRTLRLAHTAAVVAYQTIVSGGQVLVAVSAADADADNIYVFRGRVQFDKAAEALAAGAVVYWDDTAKNVTATATANTKAGIVLKAAASGDATCVVMLGENR